jgi:hypothetical protein
MKGQPSDVAAVIRTQEWIDRTEPGTPERQAAVDQMLALQRIFTKRNRAERLGR